MNLKDISIKREYRTYNDNIPRDFYFPLLSNAIAYDRAVGFFCSTVLAQIVDGVVALRNNGGKIRLVASPRLEEQDVEAIKYGYKKREEVIRLAIERELKEPINEFEKEQLNLLANLIADGVLDIRIATTGNGIYHEKMGLISDTSGNVVAFSGSMNETGSGVKRNYEAIDVYCSWKPEDEQRVADKRKRFDAIWNNTEPGVTSVEFPDLKEELIEKYRISDYDWTKPVDLPPAPEPKPEPEPVSQPVVDIKPHCYYPELPDGFKSRKYQDDAIANWAAADYRGIFDMATGTGKTLTALQAITTLYKDKKNKLAVIVVVPYQHLVEQWVEDIEKFNIRPIIGYSASRQKDWLKRLENAIDDQKLGVVGTDFFLFICTNATFVSNKVQKQIENIKTDILLVIDEAHNAGAPSFLKLLTDRYAYRLALSATIDRHNDEEGTEKLFEFFGEKCIEYTLEEAIEKGVLTQYKYYPVLTYLRPKELEEYIRYTREISKCMIIGKNGKRVLSDKGNRIALKRARVIAGAQDKLAKLETVIEPYKKDNHILVYCGSTNVIDENSDVSTTEKKDIRQILAVSDLLGNKLNMNVSRFTSEEDMFTRDLLKKDFAEGKNIQALIAIKCLDEGVNIPAIKTAFILASTTNPKEYIQRRGRVLRTFTDPETHKTKEFAEIYDFITLPRVLRSAEYLTEEEIKLELPLVKRELARAEEFARLALNMPSSNQIIDSIKETYGINSFLLTDEEEYL